MGNNQSSADIAKAASAETRDDGRTRTSWQWSRSTDTAVCKLMLPVYYINEPLNRFDFESAKTSWEIMDKNSAVPYNQLKEDHGFQSCLDWFCHIYFERLFDVHPLARKMFSDAEGKKRFLTALFKMIFGGIEDSKKFDEALIKLAERYDICYDRLVLYI